MTARSPLPRILRSILPLLCISTSVAAATRIDSTWETGGTRVDGSIEDWVGEMVWLEAPRAHLGVRNDGRHLYLALDVADRETARATRTRGMLVRLDPAGGGPLRIEYPLGKGDAGLASFLLHEPGASDPERLPADNDVGIELRLGMDDGRLVYELKIPLVRTDATPFALGARPGEKVGLAIEPARNDGKRGYRPSVGAVGSSRVTGSPMAGGGLAGDAPPAGGGSEGRGGAPDPLRLSVKIVLADQSGGRSPRPGAK